MTALDALSKRPIPRSPRISQPHKNGDYFVGDRETAFADELYERGTPPVNILFRTSVTNAIQAVRIGDRLPVSFDGKYWWASFEGQTVGRLTWPLSQQGKLHWKGYTIRFPESGTLQVERLLLDRQGSIVNIGGFVTPLE